MFIFTDFLVLSLLVFLFIGGLFLLVKNDIQFVFGKKGIRDLGWGWAIFFWVIISICLEGGWYLVARWF